jgi:hypothetical protein
VPISPAVATTAGLKPVSIMRAASAGGQREQHGVAQPSSSVEPKLLDSLG